MDYDEDIIFTIDYKLEPGTFNEENEPAEDGSSFAGLGSGWGGLDADARLSVIISIAFLVFAIFFLVVYYCCCAKKKPVDVATLENKVATESDAEGKVPSIGDDKFDDSVEIHKGGRTDHSGFKTPNSVKGKMSTHGNLIEEEDAEIDSRASRFGNRKTEHDSVNNSSKALNPPIDEEDEDEAIRDDEEGDSDGMRNAPNFKQKSVV